MKTKIILANLLDYLFMIIISGLALLPFSFNLFNAINAREIEANMIPYYMMSLVLAFYIVFSLFNLAYRFISSVLLKGKTLGRYLQYLKLVDENGYPNDIRTLFVREVLITSILNTFTLHLFNVVELIRILLGKDSFTNIWSKTKYILMEEEDGVIY